jgi:quercetin dioxygenase-like cupin family protein
VGGIEIKSFDNPDETRPFESSGRVELVTLGDREIGKAIFEPGWRWSEHVKPIAGTESCEFAHLGYVLSGRMRVYMDDGSVAEIGAGDVFAIAPGHDAEVIGDEACVTIDMGEEDANYAKRAS